MILRELILKVHPKLVDHLVNQAMTSTPNAEAEDGAPRGGGRPPPPPPPRRLIGAAPDPVIVGRRSIPKSMQASDAPVCRL